MIRAAFQLFCTAFLFLAPDARADELTNAALDVSQCRNLDNQEVRLACFDAAAEKLAGVLRSEATASQETASDSAPLHDAEPAVPTGAKESASFPERDEAPANQAPQPAGEGDGNVPVWAEAPSSDPERERDDADRFQATIVRITRNNVGRHWFYTEDGAVWEQTQIEEIRAPKSLPAVATFKKKFTGNPVIKFDVSNRAYRVRRVR